MITEEQLEHFNSQLINQEDQIQEQAWESSEINKDDDEMENQGNLDDCENTDTFLNATEELMVTNIPESPEQIEVVDMEEGSYQSNSTNIICVECHDRITDITTGSIECEICKFRLHILCGAENRKICNICSTQEIIETQQKESVEGQKRQAEQMVAVTKKMLPKVDIGDCILVNIDKIDRSPGDPPNLIAVVSDIRNCVFQVGTSGGIIKSWFNRADIKKATLNFITLNQTNTKQFISLREAVSMESLFDGKGYVKCSCRPSKVQCITNRCQCFKAKLKCNSRCHKSGPCSNK